MRDRPCGIVSLLEQLAEFAIELAPFRARLEAARDAGETLLRLVERTEESQAGESSKCGAEDAGLRDSARSRPAGLECPP